MKTELVISTINNELVDSQAEIGEGEEIKNIENRQR